MISNEEVTALTAQAAKYATTQLNQYVGPAYDSTGVLNTGWILNADNVPVYVGNLLGIVGIGVYGQTPESLTLAGYLKPGVLGLITDVSMTSIVLNTPAVWTGQLGISSLEEYLNYPDLQNLTQISLLIGAYEGLVAAGLLNGTESSRYIATFLQPASIFGVNNVVAWVSDTADGSLVSKLKVVARQGQYAIDFVTAFSSVLSNLPEINGVTNTVAREQIDQLVTEIIGNQKIPEIEFTDPPLAVITGVTVPTTGDEDSTFRFAPGNTTR